MLKFEYDSRAFEKRILRPPNAIPTLMRFQDALREVSVNDFTASHLETWMQDWVNKNGFKMGELVHPVRVAVTGKEVGLGLFETLAILGKPRCLVRIEKAIRKARETQGN